MVFSLSKNRAAALKEGTVGKLDYNLRTNNRKPKKLLDRAREIIQVKHYSIRTE